VLKPSQYLSPAAPAPAAFRPCRNPAAETIIPLDQVVNRHIETALIQFGGNRTKAADALGISRSTLKRKIKSLKDLPSGSN